MPIGANYGFFANIPRMDAYLSRRMRRENNNAVACLAAASEREQRAAFETRKDSLRRSLYEKAAAERRAGFDSLLRPFKYMPQTLWNGAAR